MYRNRRDATIGLAPLLILHATVKEATLGARCYCVSNSKACCGALYLEHIVRSHARAGAKGDAILRGGQRKESKLDLKNIIMISGGVLPKKHHVSTFPAKTYVWQAGQDCHQSKTD